MPSAIIADDEDLQRSDLRRMLALAWPELQIAAECEDGGEACEAIARLRPDVAFLDIRMPAMSGLDVARACTGIGACRVVFTTAYDSHAIDAFGLGALDYLLKPISQERLTQTVARLRSQIAAGAAAPDLLAIMAELDRRLQRDAPVERIRWISTNAGSTIKIFPVEDILFFESDSRYTRVVSATGEGLIRTPVKELLRGLDPAQFWQIHRGALVSVRAIARAQRDAMGNITVELRGHPAQLKVSPSYAWRFKSDVYSA
jgi:DNA-binding LytR/AlgR family response regulator